MSLEALDERKKKILDFLVRDYIKTAEPVSSSRVREGLDLAESPATVRNIVAELDESGYLEQPHISSGRVPTDFAYRYFVDNLILETEPERDLLLEMKRRLSRKNDDLGRIFAEVLNLLSFSGLRGGHFEGYGLSYLLGEPEFSRSNAMRGAGYLLDHINEVADIYAEEAEDERKFFIGKENPIDDIHEFGVCYMNSQDNGQRRTILLIGPKRMDYEKISNCVDYFLEER